MSVVSLETLYISLGTSNFAHKYDQISFEVVDGPHSFSSSPRSQCIPFYRSQSLWMGCSSRAYESVLSWSLDRIPIPVPYQYSRNNGHSFCVEKGHTVYTPLLCYDIHRQYNSGLKYQQIRRNTFSQSMHRSMGKLPLVPGIQCDSQNLSHSRESQHSCESSLRTRQTSQYRMVLG